MVFDIPAKYTPETRELPTAQEVEPWVATINTATVEGGFHGGDQDLPYCRSTAQGVIAVNRFRNGWPCT